MNKSFIGPMMCAAIAGVMAFASPAAAKTAKECRAEWTANKAANQAKGITEKAYVDKCKADTSAEKPKAAPAATTAKEKTPAAKEKTAPKMAAPAAGEKKTVKECEAEWRANKAANQAKGITEKAYVAECREGKAAATPAAAPAAPAQTKMALRKPSRLSPRWRRPPSPQQRRWRRQRRGARQVHGQDRTGARHGSAFGRQSIHRGRPGQGALPDRHGGLGQSQFEDLPLHRLRRLRSYEKRRLHVREGRDGAGHARRQERETALNGPGARFTQKEIDDGTFR